MVNCEVKWTSAKDGSFQGNYAWLKQFLEALIGDYEKICGLVNHKYNKRTNGIAELSRVLPNIIGDATSQKWKPWLSVISIFENHQDTMIKIFMVASGYGLVAIFWYLIFWYHCDWWLVAMDRLTIRPTSSPSRGFFLHQGSFSLVHKGFGVNYNNLTVLLKPGIHGFILGKWCPFMAARFRLVKYYNLPSFNLVWDVL